MYIHTYIHIYIPCRSIYLYMYICKIYLSISLVLHVFYVEFVYLQEEARDREVIYNTCDLENPRMATCSQPSRLVAHTSYHFYDYVTLGVVCILMSSSLALEGQRALDSRGPVKPTRPPHFLMSRNPLQKAMSFVSCQAFCQALSPASSSAPTSAEKPSRSWHTWLTYQTRLRF